MADGSRPRAVSGEIMTNPPEGVGGRVPPEVDIAGDVIDAEYISLPSELQRSESKSSGTSKSPEPVLSTPVLSIGSAAAPSAGMDMLRRTDTPAALGQPARGGPLFWAAGVGFAVAAFWVSGGHALMRGVPFVGAEPPPSALSISGVTSRVDVVRHQCHPACRRRGRERRRSRRAPAAARPSPSPAMTAASPATGWGHPAALWRQAKHSPFPAVSMCLRTE